MDSLQSPSTSLEGTFDAPTPKSSLPQPDESSEWGRAPQAAEDSASPDLSPVQLEEQPGIPPEEASPPLTQDEQLSPPEEQIAPPNESMPPMSSGNF